MKFKNIIFDCDSTLTGIEGFDELARKKGLFDQVKVITSAGMNGEIPFHESLLGRLKILKPSKEDLEWLGARYIECLLIDAKEVIGELKKRRFEIFILSGAFFPAVKILADYLGIDGDKVHALSVESLETNLDFFKTEIAQKIQQSGSTVLVGDGVTDYEAGKFVTLFIGFGGIVRREKLKKLSAVYLEEPRLQPILDIVS